MLKKLRGRISNLSSSVKRNAALVLTSALIVTTCCNFTYATQNFVTISDTGNIPVQIYTADTNVGKILSKDKECLEFLKKSTEEIDMYNKFIL